MSVQMAWDARGRTIIFLLAATSIGCLLAEFYGLWTFAIRLASIIGPLSYGAITWMTGGNQRMAILSTALLFVVGLVLLTPVNVRRGREAALRADAMA